MDKLYEDLIYLIVEYLDNNDRLKARLAEKNILQCNISTSIIKKLLHKHV